MVGLFSFSFVECDCDNLVDSNESTFLLRGNALVEVFIVAIASVGLSSWWRIAGCADIVGAGIVTVDGGDGTIAGAGMSAGTTAGSAVMADDVFISTTASVMSVVEIGV